MAGASDQTVIEQAMNSVSTAMNQVIEDENARLDHILSDDDALAKMRAQRLAQMKKEEAKSKAWRQNGHGVLQEIRDERECFRMMEESDRVVLAFYTTDSKWCAVLMEHLQVIARDHLETRFVKLDAANSPFLVEKLKIHMVPSLVLIQDGHTNHTMVGLSEITGDGKFESYELERALRSHGMLQGRVTEEKHERVRMDDEDDLDY